jgi:hypothetical protein
MFTIRYANTINQTFALKLVPGLVIETLSSQGISWEMEKTEKHCNLKMQ